MKEAHAVQLEARILEITEEITKQKSSASDEQVRLAKEEGQRDARV